MNEQQNMVIATAVAGLILIVVYLCPWRIASTEELQWSPIYQAPMSYARSFDTERGIQGSSRIESEEAHIAVGYLILEVFILLVIAGGLYVFFADSEEDMKTPSETLK